MMVRLLTASCLLAFVALGASIKRTPSHDGKGVQHWFNLLVSESPAERKQAESAFDALGASSIDFLLSQVTADVPNPIKRTHAWIEGKVLRRSQVVECGLGQVSEAVVRQARLEAAFGLLGDRAQPATGKLGELLSNPICQYEAAASLVAIGPSAWAEIQTGANSKQAGTRQAVVSTLGGATQNKTNACTLLLKALKDPDGLVRHYAAFAIGELGACPDQSVPALIAALDDPDSRVRYISIFALEKFGSNAAPAILAIRRLRNDPEENVRDSAIEIADNLEKGPVPDLP